ncbi:hypothetical protein BG015_004497 [Linnemannia schmuckeri]|uniref:Uncharacterized protein n=1 Tax=Linnemannia schmuckeri TaxID=64567 RepID=A0A9P5VD03_9FUNG|nr:hypothetical protein BG015_004497 [Linnemannia schmuckeri]
MSTSNNTPRGNSAISDHALAERLAKLKETGAAAMPSSDQDLALHFSKVFGHSPAATHLSPPPLQEGSQYQWGQESHISNSGNNNSNNEKNTLTPGGPIPMDVLGSAASQKSMSSYFIPKDSVLDQEEIDKILADSEDLLVDGNDHDDLDFLDDLDTLSPGQKQEIKLTLSSNNSNSNDKKVGDEQELDDVTKDLEKTLSKFLQNHQPPPAASHDHRRDRNSAHDNDEGQESKQERAFGDQLDRMAGVSLSTDRGGFDGDDDDEASRLITQLREEAQLESKYGNLDEARMKDLHSRNEDLKKGIQGLSSIRSNASKASSTDSDGLGPPPAAVGLDELRSGGIDDNENPDNWCCMCNEDTTWTCPGCDNDNYCEECFRESHIGPEADWEMKKHRPRPFVKASVK